MLRVLGKLARQGFSVPPHEAEDLIHGFLLTEWPALLRNYRGSKAFRPYLVKAFSNYARSWCLKERRYRRTLAVFAALAEEHYSIDSKDLLALSEVGDILDGLPQEDHDALLLYLTLSSVRSVARTLSIAPHTARERITKALGRVVAQLGRPPQITPPGWELARLSWIDQLSLEDCAAVLGMDFATVYRLHKSNESFLSLVVSQIAALGQRGRKSGS
jgi:DNA-directed RNA polymerase specialized sigma24 family protein